jgi:hypothetical protein
LNGKYDLLKLQVAICFAIKNFTTRYKLVIPDDIRFLVNSGGGMGRYIGLNVSNGAVLDANGELEAIDSTAWFVSYRHQWNDQRRSNVIYSAIEIDNDIAVGSMYYRKGC